MICPCCNIVFEPTHPAKKYITKCPNIKCRKELLIEDGNVIDHESTKNVVYLIYRNADMSGGTGPMQVVRVMTDKFKAINFAMEQPGVMGVKGRQRIEPKPYVNYYKMMHGTQLVKGDWEVIEIEVG